MQATKNKTKDTNLIFFWSLCGLGQVELSVKFWQGTGFLKAKDKDQYGAYRHKNGWENQAELADVNCFHVSQLWAATNEKDLKKKRACVVFKTKNPINTTTKKLSCLQIELDCSIRKSGESLWWRRTALKLSSCAREKRNENVINYLFTFKREFPPFCPHYIQIW